MLGVQGVLNQDDRVIGRLVSGGVVNLSRRYLSGEEVNLHCKGLKFSPVPTEIDVARVRQYVPALKSSNVELDFAGVLNV